MTNITDSLATAFDRIEDFMAVQAGNSFEGTVEAVKLLQTAVGLEAETQRIFTARMEQLNPNVHIGEVLFGTIVGLLAAQHETDRD